MRSLVRLVSVCLLLFPCCAAAAPAPGPKPDVLVILTDQWSPRYLGWDNPQVRTPNLDRIAAEGMIFDACYTTSPVCMPARVSLLTGLYPHNGGHALWGNASSYCPRPEDAPMFHDIQAAGYTTAQIGKLHWTAGPARKRQFGNDGAFHEALGLNHVLEVNGPPDSSTNNSAYAKHLRKVGLLDQLTADMHQRYVENEFEPRPSVLPVSEYHDIFVTNAAVDFIRNQPRDRPLCLVVSLHSPHPPLDAPGEFATLYDPGNLTLPPNVPEKYYREKRLMDHDATRRMLANYLGKISLVDHCAGQLIAALEARGSWDKAMVCFTSDHGEMMGAHEFLTKGRFYEESARVPLVVRWPGQVRTGRTPALAQMMDVYPTIVEAIGGTLSPGRFATSLLPVATGRAESVRALAVSEIGDRPPLRVMARNVRYKWWADELREYLYDLEADPYEMTNLADDPAHAATLGQLRGELLLHWRSTQVNAAEGYKSKVTRLREAEAAQE